MRIRLALRQPMPQTHLIIKSELLGLERNVKLEQMLHAWGFNGKCQFDEAMAAVMKAPAKASRRSEGCGDETPKKW